MRGIELRAVKLRGKSLTKNIFVELRFFYKYSENITMCKMTSDATLRFHNVCGSIFFMMDFFASPAAMTSLIWLFLILDQSLPVFNFRYFEKPRSQPADNYKMFYYGCRIKPVRKVWQVFDCCGIFDGAPGVCAP